eukprot:scaffold14077_cov129-Isochrysis_galbana.AAC.1
MRTRAQLSATLPASQGPAPAEYSPRCLLWGQHRPHPRGRNYGVMGGILPRGDDDECICTITHNTRIRRGNFRQTNLRATTVRIKHINLSVPIYHSPLCKAAPGHRYQGEGHAPSPPAAGVPFGCHGSEPDRAWEGVPVFTARYSQPARHSQPGQRGAAVEGVKSPTTSNDQASTQRDVVP